MATVSFPPQLAKFINSEAAVTVVESDLIAVFSTLCEKHPTLQGKLFSEPNKLNRFVKVFVDGKDCGSVLSKINVGESSKIKILIAMAGG